MAGGGRVLEKPKRRFPDSVNLEAVPGEAAQAWKSVHPLPLAKWTILRFSLSDLPPPPPPPLLLSPKRNRFGNFSDY